MLRFDAHPEGNKTWELKDFLYPFDGESLQWSILEFYGVGLAPDNLTMEEFTNKVASLSKGLPINWSDLLKLSGDIDQTYDCLIVGVQEFETINREDLESGRFDNTCLVVEAVDSSYWHVWVPDGYVLNR